MSKTLISSLAAILIAAMSVEVRAENGKAVAALRAEAERLHAELVLLRRIRSAQRELIEWAQVSEKGRVSGLPGQICEASALRGLCPRLGLTFSTREEAT